MRVSRSGSRRRLFSFGSVGLVLAVANLAQARPPSTALNPTPAVPGGEAWPILDFPLRGEWTVWQPPGHEAHAFDLVAVGGEHHRYFRDHWLRVVLGAVRVARWYGWSQPVYAPLAGVVVQASDGWPDREGVNLVRDGIRPLLFRPKIVHGDIRPFAGNYVVIQGEAASVLMAHFRRGSLRMSVSQRVEAGHLVAEVGNSGNSLAPHLHVQVMDGPNPLTARLIPFRVRRYERWDGAAWRAVQASPLEKGDRVRVRP